MSDHPMDECDARQQGRSDTAVGAIIERGAGKPHIRCLITNLSADGAELRLGAGDRVPPSFTLYVPHENTSYRAAVRWRDEGRVGVALDAAERRPAQLRVVK